MARKTEEISTRIRQFIIEHYPLARKHSNINTESLLLKSGIIDSMGGLDLVMFLEEEFKIIISDEDLLPENFESIVYMAAFVQSKINSQ